MISVIIPTYNERDNLSELIPRICAAFEKIEEPAELLIMDDDSPDRTAQLAQKMAEEQCDTCRIRVLVRKQDKGLAKAVDAGFQAAEGDLYIVMDADLSHPPELIPQMVARIRAGADIAVASRYITDGGIENWPWIRRIVSRGACLLARPLTPIKDATSGFFALRKETLTAANYHPRGYKIGLELFARLPHKKIIEVPFVFRDRAYGESKLGGAVMLAYLVQLAALYRARFPRLVGYLQFALVGLLGMSVDSVSFALGYWYLGLKHLGPLLGGFFAQTVSFLIAARFNFALNAAWTFRERRKHANLLAFIAVSLVGFIFRTILFEFIVSLPPPNAASIWGNIVHTITIEQIALISGIILASLWNYWGSRQWAFPSTEDDAQLDPLPRPSILVVKSWIVILICAAAILRVLFSSITPLTFDEAYYWQWSRHLAWGYFDHPPMIAYLIAGGTRLLGVTTLGVRLLPELMGVGTIWLIYRLALLYEQDYKAALWAMVLSVIIPFYAVGGIIATPDTPLVFFWAATILLILRALRTSNWFDWIFMGVLAGLGLLSKLPILILYLALFVGLLQTRRGQHALKSPKPWVALLIAGSMSIPMWLWESSHGFASIGFHLRQGLGPVAGAHKSITGWITLGQFLAGQIGVLTPILFFLTFAALLVAGKKLVRRGIVPRPHDQSPLVADEIRPFLFWPAFFTLGLFAVASFFSNSGTNWTAPAYVSAFALSGDMLSRWLEDRKQWLRWIGYLGISFAALVSMYVNIEVAHPMVAYRHYPLQFPLNQKPLAAWVDRQVHQYTIHAVPPLIIASNYKLASELAFYVHGHPETYDPFERGSGSAYLGWQKSPLSGRLGLYYANSRHPSNLKRLFVGSSHYLGSFAVKRMGVTRVTYYAFYGVLNPSAFKNHQP